MNKNEKIIKLLESKNTLSAIYKMSECEFSNFIQIVKLFFEEENDKSRDVLDIIQNYYISSKDKYFSQSKDVSKEDWIDKLYKNELSKINFVLNDNNLFDDLGGVKILLYGKTGTGKTTLANKIMEMNNEKFDIERQEFEKLINPKMGQTQINILNMLEEINLKKGKRFLFIDEIDSVITNRNNSNDLGEYQRIVGTFIKFLNEISKDVVLIAATNNFDKIDDAIVRRFNIKIKSKFLTFDQALEIIQKSTDFELSKQKYNLLSRYILDDNFTFSEVQQFITQYKIEKSINEIKFPWSFFVSEFKQKISYEDLKKDNNNDNFKSELDNWGAN